MQGRTFFRIMIDNLFINNAIGKTILALVKFCNEQSYYSKKELKFLQKMPLNRTEQIKKYDERFLFNSNPKIGANSK